MATATNIISATGRRKTAVAMINLRPGSGEIKVNGKPFDDYFTTDSQKNHAIEPLIVTESNKKFDVQIRAHGGGLNGQAGAARMAISRALVQADGELKATLKAKGMLTRDSRMRERKKSGQPGARKRFQFSKR